MRPYSVMFFGYLKKRTYVSKNNRHDTNKPYQDDTLVINKNSANGVRCGFAAIIAKADYLFSWIAVTSQLDIIVS